MWPGFAPARSISHEKTKTTIVILMVGQAVCAQYARTGKGSGLSLHYGSDLGSAAGSSKATGLP
jgi:hypothetical protein